MVGWLDGFGSSDILPATMPRRFRAALVALLVIVVLAMLALLFSQRGQIPSPSLLPNPNGYDDFVKAGQAMEGDVSSLPDLNRDSLRALVSSNSEPLRLLHLGLTRRCSFPIEAALTNFSATMSNLSRLRSLALLLRAEGRLAEMDGQPAQAARDYIQAIRLGNEISRGGFVIVRAVGITCEAIGRTSLAKLVPGLSPEQALPLLRELETIDDGRVSFDEVRRNERWFTHHEPLKEHNPLNWLMGWWQNRSAVEHFETRHKTIMAQERLLVMELALRCYWSEHGSVPAHLDDLVTNYLSKVPQDPFAGQPLIYRPQGTHWLLYSVGPDGVDDGGRPAGRGLSPKGDLLFDLPW
jgi:hypothetical protein